MYGTPVSCSAGKPTDLSFTPFTLKLARQCRIFLDVDSGIFPQQMMACVVFDIMMYAISFQAFPHVPQELIVHEFDKINKIRGYVDVISLSVDL